MTDKAKYGRRNVSKMRAEWNALRNVARAEGTPAIQAAIDDCEEWIDYSFHPRDAVPVDDVDAALVDAVVRRFVREQLAGAGLLPKEGAK